MTSCLFRFMNDPLSLSMQNSLIINSFTPEGHLRKAKVLSKGGPARSGIDLTCSQCHRNHVKFGTIRPSHGHS